ncbi:MAG TPA: MotA/TolQ/ExbB proton channel family protein, partial [Gemmataceae bacterium]|nr:MotA/TolQ/ExbB proton channel family protein [Gemmataceae bacterium]
MKRSQISSASEAASPKRRSGGSGAALLIGLPLAALVIYLVHRGPIQDPRIQRYLSHKVEWVEVAMFCTALGALLAKLRGYWSERVVFGAQLLPTWDGRPIPVTAAAGLRAGLNRLPRQLRGTYLGRRLAAILDFIASRNSTAGLDDQLRGLTDNDAIALESNYSLIRIITWAMPILGFLGTVLGITQSISGVTPEKLEHNLSEVTDGLALAFDTTALALGLTMAVMFLSFIVERAEQGVLDRVDEYVDCHLAHRFERVAGDGAGIAENVRQNTHALVRALEQVAAQQAAAWAKAQAASEERRLEADEQWQQRLAGAVESALERTLAAHSRRLAELEKQAADQSSKLVEQLGGLATVLRDTDREHQTALGRIADSMTAQVQALARLQEGEKQLVRLQEVLQQNLAALAGAGAFEEAVHNLTAAIHLLTARTAGSPTGSAGRLGTRPGAAA